MGQIEDVAVDTSYRKKNLGLRIITALMEIARAKGAYKVTLYCKESNVGFYEKVRSRH